MWRGQRRAQVKGNIYNLIPGNKNAKILIKYKIGTKEKTEADIPKLFNHPHYDVYSVHRFQKSYYELLIQQPLIKLSIENWFLQK